jgi:CIC family chloride channel protein
MAERPIPIPSNPFQWFPEFFQLSHRRVRAQARLLGLCLVVGVVAGLGAVVFHGACQAVFHVTLDCLAGYRPITPGYEPPLFHDCDTPFRPWLLLIIPTVGGLLSGWIVFTLAPEAEGHGTDAAIAAYHFGFGVIRPRVPLVKLVASAITLGTGGSGGREGPIAQIGAGCGSWLGGLLRLRPAERRVLLAAGMGAGVAAIFRAPLAGALFAAEVLYRSPDFESEVILPAALASITAYCTFGFVFNWTGYGWKPLFELPAALVAATDFHDPRQLLPYLVLALFVAVLAMVYTRTFYGLTYLFRKLPMRPHFRPAIGAFLTGVVGLALYYLLGHQRVLSVMSFGYGILQDSLRLGPDDADLHMAVILIAVALGKILTTGLTIGSGGSGGVFGPSMVIGGCGGGALGVLLHHFIPELVPHPATFLIVGMAGFFAAAAKTPFSTLVMVGELTGNYNLLLPTLWVCAISFLVSDEQSIYSQQVESRSRSPAHLGSYVREVLAGLKVGSFVTPLADTPALRPDDPVPRIIDCLAGTSFRTAPVLDAQGRLLGVVCLEEVLVAARSAELQKLALAVDLMRGHITPLEPEDSLDEAMAMFVEADLLVLPVVDGTPAGKVIGIVKRVDIAGTYLRHLQGPLAPAERVASES